MTPKEKAIKLVKRYSCLHHGIDENLFENVVVSDYAIESALIAVDEILKYIGEEDFIYPSPQFEGWQEVKNEIELL